MIKKNIFSIFQWTNIKSELQKRSQLYMICMLMTFFVVFMLGFFTNLFANQSIGDHRVNASMHWNEEPMLEKDFSTIDNQEIQKTSLAIESEIDIEPEIQAKIEEKDTTKKSKIEEKVEKSEVSSKKEPIYELTDKDLEALYRIVEAEATQEDIIGRILIANVVFNRVRSDGFPDTVYDVIHQKMNGRAQFSPIDDERYFKVTISEKTKEAVQRALEGEDHSNGALFFVARSMASQKAVSWFDRNLTKVKEHGIHEFFSY